MLFGIHDYYAAIVNGPQSGPGKMLLDLFNRGVVVTYKDGVMFVSGKAAAINQVNPEIAKHRVELSKFLSGRFRGIRRVWG